MTLVNQAIKRLKKENDAQKNSRFFDTRRPVLDVSGGPFKALIHRLRIRYGEIPREAVAQTVPDLARIDREIHVLCDGLLAAEGRLDP
jgi:hypothetical protein